MFRVKSFFFGKSLLKTSFVNLTTLETAFFSRKPTIERIEEAKTDYDWYKVNSELINKKFQQIDIGDEFEEYINSIRLKTGYLSLAQLINPSLKEISANVNISDYGEIDAVLFGSVNEYESLKIASRDYIEVEAPKGDHLLVGECKIRTTALTHDKRKPQFSRLSFAVQCRSDSTAVFCGLELCPVIFVNGSYNVFKYFKDYEWEVFNNKYPGISVFHYPFLSVEYIEESVKDMIESFGHTQVVFEALVKKGEIPIPHKDLTNAEKADYVNKWIKGISNKEISI